MNTRKESEKLDLISTPIEHKTLDKKGYSVHYFVSGNLEGETIVFLHPAFGDHQCFDKQIDYFSTKFRLITIDMLGHGLTGVGNSKDKIISTPQHISEILAAENVQKTHLVGVSLGSLLAQDFGLKYPEKTLSLTVLGGYNINQEQKEIVQSQRREMFKWLFKMIFSMDSFRRYVASISVANKTEQNRYYESAKKFTRKSFQTMSGMNQLIANRTSIQRAFPLLILVGEKEPELIFNSSQQWHKNDPTSEFQMIENAGHCANMDNSVKFNEILMRFLMTK